MKPTVIAIDPGTTRSAYCYLAAEGPEAAILSNDVLLRVLAASPAQLCAIEMIASYGMPVGREVFETCVWIGRMVQVWHQKHGSMPTLIYRKDVKLHLCGSPRAKDPNIRQSLMDRYGSERGVAIGTKRNPGPLYGFAGDMWAALAVALTFSDGLKSEAA